MLFLSIYMQSRRGYGKVADILTVFVSKKFKDLA
jgi:hypothetical protein